MIDLQFVPPAEFSRVLKLKDASAFARTDLFATLCRLNTLYMIKRAGSGHIGSSFSCLDIVSWLHLNEMNLNAGDESDVYFSSKGHDAPGLYSAMIGLGQLDFGLVHQLRRLNGLPGHPDIETPGIPTNTGSLGMGISKAKGMIQARRLRGRAGRFFVLTGDGELQEGQFWESLHSAVNHHLGELTVIVDRNAVQSDTWVSNVSDLGDLKSKIGSFGWKVAECDGHDPTELQACLADFRNYPETPKLLIANTVKGRGVSFMEHTRMTPDQELYLYHSGAPSDDDYSKGVVELRESADRQLRQLGQPILQLESIRHQSPIPSKTAQKLVGAYSRALVEQARNNSRIVALDADLVKDTGLLPFRKEFPARFFECGIAEQDMISQASGMALSGLTPVVHSFACFLSTRPNEQIFNVATERTKVVLVGSLAGLLPAGPGHSHQSIRDIAALRGNPLLVLLEPCCEAEVEMAVDFCFNGTKDSCYLRLVSIPCEIPFSLPNGYRLHEGRGVALTQGSDVAILANGPIMTSEAYKAAAELARIGVSAKVINFPWYNRVDLDWLESAIRNVRVVCTIDNHATDGGLGQFLGSQLAQHGLAEGKQVLSFGIAGIAKCGQNDEVLRAHSLDANSLCERLASAMKAKRVA